MDLLQLEHFLAVVEERTFTRAAERVGRTQPAISQSIKKLEEEVEAPLFSRDVHEVSLTEAGRVLVEYARKMVRARDDAMRDLGSLKTLKSGTLNIAAHESAAVYLLPEALRCYVGRYPDVKIGIFRSRLADIPRQVLDREVDIGFVKEEPGFHDLKAVEVHADEMVLIASPRHPLTARRDVHVRDLGTEHFVVHHLCSSTEQKILRLFEEHATPCRIVAELWSFENIKNFVQADVGLAIVPKVTVEDELADGKLARIPVAELHMPRRTLMVYRDSGYVSDSAQELIKMVRGFTWSAKNKAGADRFVRPRKRRLS
jgi:DNA-binding transcriptional LysR family regulator